MFFDMIDGTRRVKCLHFKVFFIVLLTNYTREKITAKCNFQYNESSLVCSSLETQIIGPLTLYIIELIPLKLQTLLLYTQCKVLIVELIHDYTFLVIENQSFVF